MSAKMELDILAIGVHPDDVELACAGTLLSHIAKGYKVGILDLTQGELGTRGSAKLRLEEAEKAKNIIGALIRENVSLADGFFQYNEQNIQKIIPYIRHYRPKIVLCNAVHDRHPDHGRSSKLTSDACYYSGLTKIESKWNGDIQEKWRPNAVYHYIQDYHIEPDLVVDISNYFTKKREAILAFRSQFFESDKDEPSTPISSKAFLEFIEARARTMGRHIGAEYGEGFTVERYIGVDDLFKLQ